jgi:hypothetical protein
MLRDAGSFHPGVSRGQRPGPLVAAHRGEPLAAQGHLVGQVRRGVALLGQPLQEVQRGPQVVVGDRVADGAKPFRQELGGGGGHGRLLSMRGPGELAVTQAGQSLPRSGLMADRSMPSLE